jgi:hypothetical protein
LDEEISTAYVSVACSGTQHLDKDVRVTLEKDADMLGQYNYSNYEWASEKYAKELSYKLFEMPSMSLYLKTDSKEAYATLPVKINKKDFELLSPDSTYFIPLRIKDISRYEINPQKRNALCRIYTKNRYAQTKNLTYYTMKGELIKKVDDDDPSNDIRSSISSSKIVHPLSQNSVRLFISNYNFVSEQESINKYAIVLTIDEENKVKITPYKENGLLVVKQLDPQDDIHKNVYNPITKSFSLYYKYYLKKRPGDAEPTEESEYIIVKETDKLLDSDN